MPKSAEKLTESLRLAITKMATSHFIPAKRVSVIPIAFDQDVAQLSVADVDPVDGWEVSQDPSEGTVFTWQGGNNFSAPDNGAITFEIIISEEDTGIYDMEMRWKQPSGVASDASNDVWFSAEANDSESFRDPIKTFIPGSPDTKGQFTENTAFELNSTNFVFDPSISFTTAKTYTVVIWGRSNGLTLQGIRFLPDRNDVNGATETSHTQNSDVNGWFLR